MSPRVPRMTSSEMIKFLERRGFKQFRQSGSHLVMKKAGDATAIIPVHSGKILGVGLVKKILSDAEIPEEEVRR